jgi:hypothetical protein
MKDQVHYLDKDELLAEIIKIQTDPKADKTKFATQCMLIINNLKKRPQFSGYTTNWTEDYVSNSIYKMLKYIHNFDHTRISKITNEPVSPFAYLTQIAKAAFFEVINKRKKEESYIKETVQYHELEKLVSAAYKNIDRMSTYYKDEEEGIEFFNLKKLEVDGVKFDTLKDLLQHLWDRGSRKLKIEYPKKYIITMDEFEEISKIGFFDYLDLTRKTYKQKKKEDEIEEIEEDFFRTDIDEWSEFLDEDVLEDYEEEAV